MLAPDELVLGVSVGKEARAYPLNAFRPGHCATPENFGTSGDPPTHPELLEWLSSQLVANGWQVKPLIKMLMTSAAYRQSSRPVAAAASSDPANQLFWRMRLRRLDAEVIRDGILAVSGRLDRTMGGPPIPLQARPDGLVVIDDKHLPSPTARFRRSIYVLTRRSYNLSLLTVFDQPLLAINCPCRDASALPLQSLSMLNDAFLIEQAERFAQRVATMAGTSGEKAIRAAFRLAVVRLPSATEETACSELLERQTAIYRAATALGDGKTPIPGYFERRRAVLACRRGLQSLRRRRGARRGCSMPWRRRKPRVDT